MVQPLPPEAAAVMASYLRDKPHNKPVWGKSWLGRGAEMIRLDLEAVGIGNSLSALDKVCKCL